jgi:membrane protein implicated in regulation of membrane protease activity
MTLDTVIMFAGALVAIMSYLGFPTTVDSIIFLILGIIIIACGIAVRRRGRPDTKKRSKQRMNIDEESAFRRSVTPESEAVHEET